MKKLTLSFICVLTLLVASGSAYAQAVHVRVTVPFGFTANNKTLPAGQYEVMSTGAPYSQFLEIRRLDGKYVTYVSASDLQASNRSSETKLVFQQYGNRYFLSELWMQGTRSGLEFSKAPAELHEAKNSAGQQVTVAANVAK